MLIKFLILLKYKVLCLKNGNKTDNITNNETVQGFNTILDKLYDDAKLLAHKELGKSIPTNDPVAKEKIAILVTGKPASGKSTLQ